MYNCTCAKVSMIENKILNQKGFAKPERGGRGRDPVSFPEVCQCGTLTGGWRLGEVEYYPAENKLK